MDEPLIFLERKVDHIAFLIKSAENAGIKVKIKVPSLLN